jgi:hypothetical protein
MTDMFESENQETCRTDILFDDGKKKHAATYIFCTASTKDFQATRTFFRTNPPTIAADGKSGAPGRFVNDFGMLIALSVGTITMLMAIVL